jgi:uncharacterized protein YjbJ (UPF0337 family)
MDGSDDKAEGTGDDLKGKAQETWGRVTGDEDKQVEGQGQ